MYQHLKRSESIIGSLCKELEMLNGRYKNIIRGIHNCNDKRLIERLVKEKIMLEYRKKEIKNIAIKTSKTINIDKLSLSFLFELTNRTTTFKDSFDLTGT